MDTSVLRINFASYTSVKIGTSLEVEILNHATPKQDRKILGRGCNLLIGPQASKLAILGDQFKGISVHEGSLKVGAATSASKLFAYAKAHNLKGFEFLSHLPGSVGGLVKMNAGMSLANHRHEISQILIGVQYAQGFVPADKLELGYRHSLVNDIIYHAFFKIEHGFNESLLESFKQIRLKQPKGASFGSVFKNPPNDFAGRLIEAVGLKGVSHNGIGFSQKHANFLINTHKASFDDALFLINEAKRRVFLEFGIMLEEEVVIINH